jgi:hypothetical protein
MAPGRPQRQAGDLDRVNVAPDRAGQSGAAGNPEDVTSPAGHNRLVPNLDPVAVLDVLAAHPSLRAFVRDHRVDTMPAKLSRRRELLDEVAQAFKPGVRYSEREVNGFLTAIHPDWAALRRYLVDEGFLDREGGLYWRAGGTVPAQPD